MKDGWYKIEHEGLDNVVYVENDTIVVKEDEWGDHKKTVNIPVTDEMKKNMVIMEFDGVGVA